MMKLAVIERCSWPGAWWSKHIGRTIRVIQTDDHGHWTRDTKTSETDYPFLQWILIADCSQTFDGPN